VAGTQKPSKISASTDTDSFDHFVNRVCFPEKFDGVRSCQSGGATDLAIVLARSNFFLLLDHLIIFDGE
jgi:hypothetical protein